MKNLIPKDIESQTNDSIFFILKWMTKTLKKSWKAWTPEKVYKYKRASFIWNKKIWLNWNQSNCRIRAKSVESWIISKMLWSVHSPPLAFSSSNLLFGFFKRVQRKYGFVECLFFAIVDFYLFDNSFGVAHTKNRVHTHNAETIARLILLKFSKTRQKPASIKVRHNTSNKRKADAAYNIVVIPFLFIPFRNNEALG